MILDKTLVFCEGQDIDGISGSASAVASTDVITVGKADFGYKGMFFIVKADEQIKEASADGTVTFSLIASDDSTFSTGTVTILAEAVANFASESAGVAKDEVIVKALVRDCAGKKYIKAQFQGDGTWTANAGQGSSMKVSAFLAFDFPNK